MIPAKIRHTFELVKFSHSIFALPFALASLFLAARGMPSLKILFLVIVCMVLARNTAMAFNRLIDAEIDARNPRTSGRHLPAGLLSRNFVIVFILANSALFILTTSFINSLAFVLSPIALFVVCLYSLTKRFTHWAQLFLGLSLGIAPLAAWIAVQGTLKLPALLLGGAVLFWVAGFDTIYATQDHEFDKKEGLKSLVARYGISQALRITHFFHLISVVFLLFLGLALSLGIIYWITLTLISLALLTENLLVSPNDLSRVNSAFFTVNGFVGIFFLAGVLGEVFLK